jgi:hypothetical protein
MLTGPGSVLVAARPAVLLTAGTALPKTSNGAFVTRGFHVGNLRCQTILIPHRKGDAK